MGSNKTQKSYMSSIYVSSIVEHVKDVGVLML